MRTLDPTLQRYGTDSIANEIGLESGSIVDAHMPDRIRSRLIQCVRWTRRYSVTVLTPSLTRLG